MTPYVPFVCSCLGLRQIVGSLNVALATAALIQSIVRSARYNTIDELLALIKAVGRKLTEANPKGMYTHYISRNVSHPSRRACRRQYHSSNPSSHSGRIPRRCCRPCFLRPQLHSFYPSYGSPHTGSQRSFRPLSFCRPTSHRRRSLLTHSYPNVPPDFTLKLCRHAALSSSDGKEWCPWWRDSGRILGEYNEFVCDS